MKQSEFNRRKDKEYFNPFKKKRERPKSKYYMQHPTVHHDRKLFSKARKRQVKRVNRNRRILKLSEIISIKDAAQFLSEAKAAGKYKGAVSRSRLYQIVELGLLPVHHVGSGLFIERLALEEFIKTPRPRGRPKKELDIEKQKELLKRYL